MSKIDQFRDNVANIAAFEPLTAEQQEALVGLAVAQKATGPVGTGDFSRYESVTYQGLSVAAILDTYNSAMVQPNPHFSGEMNYLANKMLATQGIADLKAHVFDDQTVALDGKDITAQVKEAFDWLVEHSFVL